MNKMEQRVHVTDFTDTMRKMLTVKGDDYAGEEDRLANFRDAALIAGITPAQGVLYMMATKLVRIRTLQKRSAMNEPLSDSVLDVANYAVLLDEVMNESIECTSVRQFDSGVMAELFNYIQHEVQVWLNANPKYTEYLGPVLIHDPAGDVINLQYKQFGINEMFTNDEEGGHSMFHKALMFWRKRFVDVKHSVMAE